MWVWFNIFEWLFPGVWKDKFNSETFFGGGWGLNFRSCIYYASSLPIKLSSRRYLIVKLIVGHMRTRKRCENYYIYFIIVLLQMKDHFSKVIL